MARLTGLPERAKLDALGLTNGVSTLLVVGAVVAVLSLAYCATGRVGW